MSQLLGCAADGRTVYMTFARKRPSTPREFGRVKALAKRQGIVIPPAGAERRRGTHVDYLVAEYSVRTGRVRDVALLPAAFA